MCQGMSWAPESGIQGVFGCPVGRRAVGTLHDTQPEFEANLLSRRPEHSRLNVLAAGWPRRQRSSAAFPAGTVGTRTFNLERSTLAPLA